MLCKLWHITWPWELRCPKNLYNILHSTVCMLSFLKSYEIVISFFIVNMYEARRLCLKLLTLIAIYSSKIEQPDFKMSISYVRFFLRSSAGIYSAAGILNGDWLHLIAIFSRYCQVMFSWFHQPLKQYRSKGRLQYVSQMLTVVYRLHNLYHYICT